MGEPGEIGGHPISQSAHGPQIQISRGLRGSTPSSETFLWGLETHSCGEPCTPGGHGARGLETPGVSSTSLARKGDEKSWDHLGVQWGCGSSNEVLRANPQDEVPNMGVGLPRLRFSQDSSESGQLGGQDIPLKRVFRVPPVGSAASLRAFGGLQGQEAKAAPSTRGCREPAPTQAAPWVHPAGHP